MSNKCDHCPRLGDSRACPGERSRFVCERAHQPGLIAQLRASNPAEGPGLLRKAVNFTSAVVAHVAAGMPQARDAVQASRMATCRENRCGYYGAGDRCLHNACGCYLVVKTGWDNEKCPIGYW